MSKLAHDNDASLADFMAGWKRHHQYSLMPEGFAVIALTNFGERPLPSARLAEILGRPVSEAETVARQWAWPGPQVENGLITINPERVLLAPRRQLQIGDRRFGVTGCAPDVFLYAPLVRPSLQVEETCPATGTPIRLLFTPSRVEHVEPAGVVVPVPSPLEVDCVEGMGTPGCKADATLCAECPFYSSAEAAQGWLAAHPGGRVFPVREAWDLSVHREWRDRMSALLNLDKTAPSAARPH
ncbi:MAG TPA: organomercurial lyase [Candidatus Dormibacteraeota bacterium]|nr:organomercurial lyase [Candidatus Dormibacteraeota bacterium]